jgi:hypothetical protein
MARPLSAGWYGTAKPASATDDTLADRWIKKLKNNRGIAFIVVGGVVIIAAGAVVDNGHKLLGLLPSRTPVTTSQPISKPPENTDAVPVVVLTPEKQRVELVPQGARGTLPKPSIVMAAVEPDPNPVDADSNDSRHCNVRFRDGSTLRIVVANPKPGFDKLDFECANCGSYTGKYQRDLRVKVQDVADFPYIASGGKLEVSYLGGVQAVPISYQANAGCVGGVNHISGLKLVIETQSLY